MDIRGVAFDIDGTLYSNPRFYLRALAHGIRNFRLMRHFSRVRKDIRRIRSINDFHELQGRMLSEAMSIPEAEARRLIAERFYRKSEDLLVNMPLYSGVREAIHELAEMGLKLGVVSDFPVVRKLTILNLSDIWDCAYSTEDTGYLKPNPEAFAPLEECMDLPPREILYVGNSYPYDIIGASRAGFRTAYLSRREPKDSIADLTFFRYPALVEWIRARVA